MSITEKMKNEYAFILIINIIIENLKFNYLNNQVR